MNLRIEKLTACVGENEQAKTIINSLSLEIPAGEVHAVMGPNGAGKSTLSHILSGQSEYSIINGKIWLNDLDLLDLSPEERAHHGLFLSFQHPVEIPGVPVLTFVRAAMNAQLRQRDLPEISAPAFLAKARKIAGKLRLSQELLKRPLNVGFSGGEKKRLEIFQMMMLEPRFIILDEIDSGLDIDALRLVADGVNALRTPERSFLIITHYQRLLDYIIPDRVHVLANGKIQKSGEAQLVQTLEKEGYSPILESALT